MKYLKGTSTLRLNPELCTGCKSCIEVCPREVFEMQNKRAVITDLDLCMECGACENNCESGALSVLSGTGCASAIIGSMFNGGEVCCGKDGCC